MKAANFSVPICSRTTARVHSPNFVLGRVRLLLLLMVATWNVAVGEVIVPSSIGSDTIWSAAESPYVFQADVTIEVGATLTIQPGVVVKAYPLCSLYVKGGLMAQGTAGAQVIFTSLKDDSDGHDTNGDGSDSVPAWGDWGGISFSDTCADSVLSHVIVRYGGREYSFPLYPAVPAVEVRSSNIVISECVIADNNSHGIGVTGASRTMEISNCSVGRNLGSGIYLDSASPTIVGSVIIENGGASAGSGIALRSSSNPDIRDNKIADNAHWAMSADASSSGATIQGNELAGPKAGIFVVAGELVADTTWASDSAYVVNYYADSYTMHLTIAEGATLEIKPGVVAKFEKNARLVIRGDLIAQGTADDRIVFTSLQDDSQGGDTNGDGDATSPTKNDWGDLIFWDTCAGSTLDHVEVRYAGETWSDPSAVPLPAIIGLTSNLTIADCTVSDNGQDGISIRLGSPTIHDTTISNNEGCGVDLRAASPTITRNTISGNSVGIAHALDTAGTVYLNDFLNNTSHVSGQSSSILWWSPALLPYAYGGLYRMKHLGNHWDDYTGADSNGDGIGDTPYVFQSGQDDFPLITSGANYGSEGGGSKPDVVWKSAHPSNYDVCDRESTYDIGYIVIHTTGDSYESAIEWFAQPHAPKPPTSAHYIINAEGTEITQMVMDKDIAYHAGNWEYNTLSIGIEHEGDATDPDWQYSEGLYVKSALLVQYLCDSYDVPKDRAHVIGHSEIVAAKPDPGKNWNWNHYMDLVRGLDGITVTAYSPVDITVEDPDGHIASKEASSIPDAVYVEVDIDGDGAADDQVNIAQRKFGDYRITISQQIGAAPTETYSLEVGVGKTVIVLAEDVSIADIPEGPFIIELTGDQVNAIFPAGIDFRPKTLDLRAKGRFVTAAIRLPGEFDVRNIDVSTVRLNDVVPGRIRLGKVRELIGLKCATWAIEETDEELAPNLTNLTKGRGRKRRSVLVVQFDRQAVCALLSPGEQTIEVSGRLKDGTLFAGTDTIKVIDGFKWSDFWSHIGQNERATSGSPETPSQTANKPPVANAGSDIRILSVNQATTIVRGTATDPDGDTLQFRWLDADYLLSGWLEVGAGGDASVALGPLDALAIGDHSLTLEVTDGHLTEADSMVLTVENTPPKVEAAKEPQSVAVDTDPIVLTANVSDFDGDTLQYEWLKGKELIGGGTVATPQGGETVTLPEVAIPPGDARFPVGRHNVTVRVYDGANDPVSASVTVGVVRRSSWR